MAVTMTALAAVKRDIMTYHISCGPEDNNRGRVAEDIVGDGAHIPLLLGNQAPLFAFLKTKINTTMTGHLSTSSLISPSFQGDPTIFHKGIFLKQTPHIKN